MKRIVLLIIVIAFLLSGCEKNYDINERLIVQGVGIDCLSENEVSVTVQALNTDTYSGIGGAKVPEKLVKNYVLKGNSVADALSKLDSFSGRQPLFTHTRIVLIGKEQAQKGMRDVIDFFSRDSSCHASLYVAVCDGKAGELLKAEAGSESIPAVEIENAVGASKLGSDSVNIHIYELIKMYREKTTSAFLPIVKTVGEGNEKKVRISGTAVFDSDRMTDEINEEETFLLMLFLNRIKKGTYSLEYFDGDASFKLYKTKCKTDVSAGERGNLMFSVKIKCTVDCVEFSDEKDSELDLQKQNELEDLLEKELSNKIRVFLYSMCRNKNDCMRLGRVLLLKKPNEYKEKENDWQSVLPTVSFDVNVSASLRRIGQESGKSAL